MTKKHDHSSVGRSSGIDIIKIIAVILVPSLHFFLNFGFYSQPYNRIGMIAQESVRWISFSCIGLFILSSGYLQCNKQIKAGTFRKILKYMIPYCVYCIFTALSIHGVANTNVFTNILYYLFQFPGYFWYMSFFFGFFFLIPFFNLISNNIPDQKTYSLFLLILLAVISVPEFVNSVSHTFDLPNWWSGFFPVVYYFIGAYFRKYKPVIKKRYAVAVLIGIPVLISLLDFYISKGGVPTVAGGGYGSLITVLISVSIFLLLYQVHIKSNAVQKGLGILSGMTLNIYLGYMVSDRFTSAVLNQYFTSLTGKYHFALYFIEFPLNFLFAFLFAAVYLLLETIIRRLLIKKGQNVQV